MDLYLAVANELRIIKTFLHQPSCLQFIAQWNEDNKDDPCHKETYTVQQGKDENPFTENEWIMLNEGHKISKNKFDRDTKRQCKKCLSNEKCRHKKKHEIGCIFYDPDYDMSWIDKKETKEDSNYYFIMKPYFDMEKDKDNISDQGLNCRGTAFPNKSTRIGLTEELIKWKWSRIEVKFYR